MAYSSEYKIKNRKKYKGNPNKIKTRSLWELGFCRWCDRNNNVVRWSFEEVRVPYYSTVENKRRQYIVDFWVKMENGVEYLIEIKPSKQLSPPKKPKRMTRKAKESLMYESYHWRVNNDKWKAANEFATRRNMKFVIMTEQRLNKLGIKTGRYGKN